MKNFSQGVRGYLFQGRFSSCALDEQHLLAVARYIAWNPVSAGLVKNPWDYPWSSPGFQVGISDHGPLVKDRTLLGLIADWEEFFGLEGEEEPGIFRQATRTERPAGDEIFVAKIESLTGRELKIKSAGRPPKLA